MYTAWCTFNLPRVKCPPSVMVQKFAEGVLARVSSSSSDNNSKAEITSQKAFCRFKMPNPTKLNCKQISLKQKRNPKKQIDDLWKQVIWRKTSIYAPKKFKIRKINKLIIK
ncbi:hypothetical protein AVEN_212805-1 [Araneus ventricosus]|uniref:Uncharacterized protein n=1 Tax=Araneus ventricosus TaxID=182803 RepID=A0A4Y2KZF2_ARAVE|nr:hypothetical protein AVEN_212805-1 [Araneus ventricosus]